MARILVSYLERRILRERFCEGGDAAFVTSLREAAPWYSGRGGKSGSTFLKTLDDRYLLKQVPRSELWAFHEHAPTYFSFVSKTPTTLPSALVKVLGALLVEYRDATATKQQQFLVVQENLFYGHTITRMCDLKGAHRNRGGEDENETVLDENLFRFNNGYPLLLSEAAKQRLTRALWNDTLFLASMSAYERCAISDGLKEVRYRKDEPIIHQGDVGDTFVAVRYCLKAFRAVFRRFGDAIALFF